MSSSGAPAKVVVEKPRDALDGATRLLARGVALERVGGAAFGLEGGLDTGGLGGGVEPVGVVVEDLLGADLDEQRGQAPAR